MEPTLLSDLIMDEVPFSDDELLAALDFDWVDGPDGEEREAAEERTRWKPTSDRSAEWALLRLIEKRAAISEVEANARAMREPILAELDRIAKYEEKATRDARAAAAHFEHLLSQWAIERRTDRQASFVLPSGIVQTTSKSDAVTKVTGKAADEKAVEWARRRGIEINRKVEESVNLADAKPRCEIVPRIIEIHDPKLGLISEVEAWVQAPPEVVAEWVEAPTDDDPKAGSWRITNTETGETLTYAEVVEGPFVVDTETREVLEDFLTVRRGGVTAEVHITALT